MRNVLTPSRLVLAGALAGLLGCSSEPAEPGGSSDGGSPSTGRSGGVEPASCPDGPDRTTDTEVVTVGLVQGQIIDETGEPASSGLVQVCGKNICINADVDDSGKLYATINKELDAPAVKYGDGRTFGKLGFPIDGGDSELGTLTTIRLPSFDEGVPLTPGETATSAGVSLALAADAQVEVDILTYEDETEHGFRAAMLPAEALARLDPDFVLGFAVAPVETHIGPNPSLTIENKTELAPGTQLELHILGLDVLEEWAPYAGWQYVGDGQVSDDGATLEFPDGVPLLTAIGIREKR